MLKRLSDLYKRYIWNPEKYARSLGVKIGKRCSIATYDWGSEPYLITIGDHVQVTSHVRFFTHGACWVLREECPDFDVFGKIIVGNNVYIGNCALILAGVTIGNNTIIAAGAVVTKSHPDGVILAGNPAKVVGNVIDFKEKMLPYNLNTKSLPNKREILENTSESLFIKK
jgi:acetyltransferase-like isoleucine patch superfamily enzyme